MFKVEVLNGVMKKEDGEEMYAMSGADAPLMAELWDNEKDSEGDRVKSGQRLTVYFVFSERRAAVVSSLEDHHTVRQDKLVSGITSNTNRLVWAIFWLWTCKMQACFSVGCYGHNSCLQARDDVSQIGTLSSNYMVSLEDVLRPGLGLAS